jgi:hypothetical protein
MGVTHKGKRTIAEIFDDDEAIDRALADAVRNALRRHKLLGNPVAGWRDGRVVWIAPEDIQIDDATYGSDPYPSRAK